MVKLEDLKEGMNVLGLDGAGAVKITSVMPCGPDARQVSFRRVDGRDDSRFLLRVNEAELTFEAAHPWTFTADSDKTRLALEAHRISLASLYDPYLAVRTSKVRPLPHQISAVYQEMLPRLPLRYVLADDPGAGKTVMTGLLVKEMMARGDLKRCLIVCPGSLAEQWQDELFEKFGLRFTILTNDCFEAALSRNAFCENDLCIGRLDKLARDEDIQAKLALSSWDLVVIDEAHKLSATVSGTKKDKTKRYKLGELLGGITENLLLLTATPHNGKPKDFQMFMALVDPDRFEGAERANKTPDVSDVMRRLLKEDLLTFEGKPLFPERVAQTVSYSLSPAEEELYDEVTAYVREGFNRADRLDGKRKNSVGFALTSLQRRLASSPAAIYKSLERREKRLKDRLEEVRCQGKPVWDDSIPTDLTDDDLDELTGEQAQEREEAVTDAATAAATAEELEAEIAELAHLTVLARRLLASGADRKWEELSRLLQDNREMFSGDGRREKLIIFTEHKDTLNYLRSKIASLLGDEQAVVTIAGGMGRDARHAMERRFTQDKDVRVLIATDAAGEGINLQRAHLMVNYDLPWNPNRLEQRFGRIHRIGQTEVCFLWNLVSAQTREGEVYQRLLSKLEEEKAALGGRVFDVLGRVTFDNVPLHDLLVQAVRYGDSPEVRDRLNQVVDSSLDADALKRLIADYALTEQTLGLSDVLAVKRDMELAAARKLEPHFLQAFFLKALRTLGGRVAVREPGRWEVTRVPRCVLDASHGLGGGAGEVLTGYERVCFDPGAVSSAQPQADLLTPGHPLMAAVVFATQCMWGLAMDEGTVFVDDEDWGDDPRLLFCAELSLVDGTRTVCGDSHVISKTARFVEVKPSGETQPAGYAPYLDYRDPTEDERRAVLAYVEGSDPFPQGAEELALGCVAQTLLPEHLGEVASRRRAQVEKTEAAVRERMGAEMRFWDMRAAELEEKENAGKSNSRLNSQKAWARLDELTRRRDARLAHLEAEKRVSALMPRVTGGSLVVPRGLLARLMGQAEPDTRALRRRSQVEAAAMDAVMRAERDMGNDPYDVSSQNVGYDVRSLVGEDAAQSGPATRFIEVKGRVAGAATVTVSRNEVLCALNNPESFYLAVVEVAFEEVSGMVSHTKTTYLKHPFAHAMDDSAASINYDLAQLMRCAEVVCTREEAR